LKHLFGFDFLAIQFYSFFFLKIYLLKRESAHEQREGQRERDKQTTHPVGSLPLRPKPRTPRS